MTQHLSLLFNVKKKKSETSYLFYPLLKKKKKSVSDFLKRTTQSLSLSLCFVPYHLLIDSPSGDHLMSFMNFFGLIQRTKRAQSLYQVPAWYNKITISLSRFIQKLIVFGLFNKKKKILHNNCTHACFILSIACCNLLKHFFFDHHAVAYLNSEFTQPHTDCE